MLAEIRTFYVLNYNALTAWATLGAVLVALFYEPLRHRWFSPRLVITWRRRDSDSVNVDPIFDPENEILQFRLLVRNDGRKAAHHVEAVVTDLYREGDRGVFEMVPQFLSTALKWTHSKESVREFLPARSGRLLDLGIFTNTSAPTGTVNTFRFSTEIEPKNRYNVLADGVYAARIVVSALNCASASAELLILIGSQPRFANPESGLFTVSSFPNGRRSELERADRVS